MAIDEKTQATIDPVKAAALAALDAGFSIVAIRRIGEIYRHPEKGNVMAGPKQPCGLWKPFQLKPPTSRQVGKWFAGDHGRGFALILGLVSKNAECLEFDDLETEQAFEREAESAGLTPILDRIRAGYSQRSPRGTSHFIYRCEIVAGSMKLAQKATGELDAHGKAKLKTLAETKGEAAYVIAAPSPGTVHSTGLPYVQHGGSLASVATITVNERTQLLALAATFDESPEPEPEQKGKPKPKATSKPSNGDLRPGDDYNAKATLETWSELLPVLGWTRTSQGNGREFWKHGDTDKDVSAVVGGRKNVMVVHSTSTPFKAWSPSEPNSYTPFAAYTTIFHKNDYKAAAKALAGKGYGTKTAKAKFTKFTSNTATRSPAGGPQAEPTAESEAEQELEIHLTDMGNALRFVADHSDDVRHVVGWGWLAWAGKRWVRDDAGRAQELAKRTVAKMYSEAAERMRALADKLQAMSGEDHDPILSPSDLTDEEAEQADRLKKMMKAAKKFLDWAMASEHVARIAAMLTLAKSDSRIVLSVEKFNADAFAFNCDNGTVNLKTGELKPHNRKDLITKISPVVFDQNAGCELWVKYLLATFAADLELIRWLRRWCGYTITADVREQIIAIFHGNGGNGKSVFVETLLDIAGDYSLKANAELLLAGKNDRHETEKAQLAGRRFVAAVETGEGRRLNETLVKEASGGDTITARYMREDHFSFKPTFKLALATNHKPEVRGTDMGIWRRVRLVPFNQRFWKVGEPEGKPDMKADPALREKLKAEYPGILAWIVTGCVQWIKEGLGTCKAVEAATNEYRQSEDRVGEFVEESCELDPKAEAFASVLFKAYAKWSEDRGERPLTQTMFGTRLSQMNLEKRKSHGRKILIGIRLKANGDSGDS